MGKNKFDNYSKEELVALLKLKSIELNRTLVYRDLCSKNELPTLETILKKLDLNNWNEILEYCGFKPNKKLYKYSNEELLEFLRKRAKDLGRSPTTKEIGKKYNIPSTQTYYTQFNTNSWNEILKLAGLELNHFQGYTKEYALERLREYYKTFDKIPTAVEFRGGNWTPKYDYYYDNFGTFENALYEAGLIEIPLSDEERIKISIDELIKLANTIKKCPTVYQYESLKHRGLVRRELEKKLSLKYNDICRKYIPQYSLNQIMKEATKEELILDLTLLKNKLTRTPMIQDLSNNKDIIRYSSTVYYRVFNKTYNEIIEELGWELYGHKSLKKTDDELLIDFNNLYKKYNTIPTYLNFNSNTLASYETYSYRFGSIENVCKLLGIDYSTYQNSNRYGICCVDNNGGLCKSLIERDITNYYIKNSIYYEKQPYYNELVNYDNKRFDWKIKPNSEFYYVEYFGMYDTRSKSKACKKYIDKTKRKIKKLYKAGVIDKCIFIFPNDIKYKSLDEIFSKVINKEYKEEVV
jgi:hypothetical protein